MEQPRIEKDAETGLTYFLQQDVKIPIDDSSILKSIEVIDKLNIAIWIKLATINHIPVEPLDKKLLKPLLMGIIQNSWWRILGKKSEEELAKLETKQLERIAKYKTMLEDLKNNPDRVASKAGGAVRESKGPRAVKAYRLKASAKETWEKFKGQKQVMVAHMLALKAVGPDGPFLPTSAIAEGLTAEALNTKQPPERVVGFYFNDWGHKGLIEESGAPVTVAAPAAAEPEIPQADPEAQKDVAAAPAKGDKVKGAATKKKK